MSRIAPMRPPLGLKPEKVVTTKARQAARGENCTLRLSCCNGDPETTVLAHYRIFGWAGTAQKPADYLGCFACSDCHDAIDRRANADLWGFDDLLRAMGETLMRQFEKGTWK